MTCSAVRVGTRNEYLGFYLYYRIPAGGVSFSRSALVRKILLIEIPR